MHQKKIFLENKIYYFNSFKYQLPADGVEEWTMDDGLSWWYAASKLLKTKEDEDDGR